MSTAFEHAVRRLPGVGGLHEPFSSAFYLGAERSSPRYASRPPAPGYRYHEVRARLEAEHPGVRALFVKDMAYALQARWDRLPAEHVHSLLIRDPRRSLASLHRLIASARVPQWRRFIASEAGFVDLWDLYRHLRGTGATPVVVEAEDLLRDPRRTLHAYCAAVGLDFDPVMLSWEPGQGSAEWGQWGPAWYSTLSRSAGFSPRPPEPAAAREGLPVEVRAAIDASMPAYAELRQRRLRIPS